LVLKIYMKKNIFILIAAGMVSVLISCGAEKSPFDKKPSGNTETGTNNNQVKKIYTGQELYNDKCTACHGGDGNLGIGGAKKITASTLTQEQRVELITNGKKTMPAFKSQLSEEEIKAVAEYTFTLK